MQPLYQLLDVDLDLRQSQCSASLQQNPSPHLPARSHQQDLHFPPDLSLGVGGVLLQDRFHAKPQGACIWEIPLGPQVDGFGCVEQLEQSGRGPEEQARAGQLGQRCQEWRSREPRPREGCESPQELQQPVRVSAGELV